MQTARLQEMPYLRPFGGGGCFSGKLSIQINISFIQTGAFAIFKWNIFSPREIKIS